MLFGVLGFAGAEGFPSTYASGEEIGERRLQETGN
jgi:hypothetical protein